MDSEEAVVLNWVLRVYHLNKWPKLLDDFNVVCAYPKIGAHDEIFEERLTKSFFLQSNSQFCQDLDSLAVDGSQGQSLQDCE